MQGEPALNDKVAGPDGPAQISDKTHMPASALLGVIASVTGKRWTARCQDMRDAESISLKAQVPDFIGQMLSGREISSEQSAPFLDPKLRDFLPDPSSFSDMDKASQLILDAMDAGQKITIFADYDVDGDTSAAQLIRWGKAMGHDFGLYVPDRVKEGYGPNAGAFDIIKANGTQLVITVDCGAAAKAALEHAAEIDLPVIVVDHHLMDEDLPPALAVINPNRKDDKSGQGHMAAAGVTFMLLVALSRDAKRRELSNVPNLLSFLDLAALGTICDVVSLTGVNRALVSQGLKVLSARNNAGIAALADVAGASGPLGTYHGGFVLGPRINAGGRIGKANMGAKLLSALAPEAELYAMAQELDRVNQERKELQDTVLSQALEQARALPADQAVIIVASEGWHPGIIGIVAGRLKDRMGKPAIVIGIDEDGTGKVAIGKGSGRSIKGVNLGGAISKAKAAGLLSSGGGHEMAGGLTVAKNKIKLLSSFLNAELGEAVAEARAKASLKIDAVLSPGAVNHELLEQAAKVGPFGAGNPQPLFAFADMRITYAERVRGGHVRCAFEDAGGLRVSGICFRAEESGLDEILLQANPPIVHVAGRLKADEWQGRKRIDLQVQDISIASS